jgi:hypothetical protein
MTVGDAEHKATGHATLYEHDAQSSSAKDMTNAGIDRMLKVTQY